MECNYLMADTEMPPCMLYPRFLADMKISSTAKLLYVRLLDKVVNEKVADSNGHLYTIFPISEQMAALSRSDATVKRALLELEQAELLKRKRQGRRVVIHVKLVQEDGKLIFSVRNPVVEKVLVTEGIGLLNVKAVTDKYGGDFAVSCDEEKFQAVITLWYFKKKSENVKIGRIHIDGELLPQVLAVGVSALLMQVLTLVQQTVIYRVASVYGGENSQILLGAALRFWNFSFVPLWGINQGFQPAAGTNYGAKDYDRVKKLTGEFITAATVLSLLFYIPVELFPDKVLSMFVTTPGVAASGATR